uniref:HotDog ACOT-type domain-containing protein n=1 Tax=Caenorhabditis japonica TaxID=281687 RepID=A0A8R1I2A6_CAEJA
MANQNQVRMLIQNLKHDKLRLPGTQDVASNIRTLKELKETLYSHARKLTGTEYTARIPLESRKKEQSLLKVVVPLASDSTARLSLTDSQNNIRYGKLLQWIDTIASCSALMLNRQNLSTHHFDIGTIPRLFATDRVHQTDFTNGQKYSPFEDILLESKVSWTSATQTEVTIEVKQKDEDLLVTRLVLSSFNPHDTTKTEPSNQLEVAGAYQTFLHLKREKINTSPSLDPPASHLKLPTPNDGAVPMSSTCIQQTVTTELDESPYGFVSGGFLIRNAIETSASCGKLFSGANCHASSIVEAEIQKLIPLGAVLKFSSFIASVNNSQTIRTMLIATNVEHYNFESKMFENIGNFLFTFQSRGENEHQLKEVFPQSIEEFLYHYKAQNVGKKQKTITTSCY